MKKYFIIFLGILMSNILFAQTENYKTAINNFQKSYNTNNYLEVFNSFSAEMQNALPLEQTTEFLNNLKNQLGLIESTTYIGQEEETFSVFKTIFQKGIFCINLSLDKDHKIDGMFLKPFIESVANSAVYNNVVNDLSSYPKEIADIIFAKTKSFPNNTQLSIAMIADGKTKYYGVIKENDTIKPIANQNQIFEIGSITKAFTSTVLASLVTDKKLKLSDKVNAYYSFPFKDDIQITFQDIANHTSGLSRLPENLDVSNISNPYKSYGKAELETYLKNDLKLHTKPGEAYAYSNLGAGLLGYTMGVSQKTSFQNLLQKRVFNKYKMNNSYTSSHNLGDRLVKGLNPDGEVFPNWDFDVLFAGGGILSTTADLSKFAIAQFDSKNKELALTRKSTFVINDNMSIGLGWHLLKSDHGKELIWHNGGTGGYSSSMIVNTSNKTAVIILSTLSAFHPENPSIDSIAFELMNTTENN